MKSKEDIEMNEEYEKNTGMPEENKSNDDDVAGEQLQQDQIRTEETTVPTEIEAKTEEVKAEVPHYTDPNAEVVPQHEMPYQNAGTYQNQQGQANSQSQQTQTNAYSYGNGGSNNQNSAPNYNQGSNAGYNNGYNPSPNYSAEDEKRVMSMGDWVLTLLAFMIPCAGIILYFVWAFSNGGNQNRKNFCRAYLIIAGICMVIGLILWVVMFAVVGTSMRYYYY